MLTGLRFERLQEHHIPAILEIEQEANTAPWSEQSFKNELINNQSVFLTVFQDSRVIGYGGFWTCIDEAHITTVAIAASERRKGYGRALVIELLKRAKEKNMLCSTLEVRAGNQAAIALYEELGYKPTATRRGYYPDNKEDAIVMWLYGLQDWTAPN